MKKGYTLIEVIIYLGIVSMVIVAFIVFVFSISDPSSKTYVVSEVQANMRIASNLIAQKIRASTGINIASSTFDVDPGVLSLQMASSTLNPTVFSLSADNGILQITQGAGSPIDITSDEVRVVNLIFRDYTLSNERENIRVEIEMEFDNTDDIDFQYSQGIKTTVGVRN